MSTVKKVFKWAALIFWLFIIFGFSAQNGQVSQATSDGLLTLIYRFFQSFLPYSADEFYVLFSITIRKIAHFGEYFILGLLTYNCFRDFKTRHHPLLALVFTLLAAVFDEGHQLLVPGRSFGLMDILIDVAGAWGAILLWKCWAIRKN